MLNGIVVYRDGNHMTATFAARWQSALANEISSIQKLTPQLALAALSLDVN
jgi:hypothetical protein